MTITARTPLVRVAAAIGHALRSAGIDAVLTGGACTSLHADGAYQSLDIDFVLRSRERIADLDAAMAAVGYRRDGRRYVHAASPYFVEFLGGPVAIGLDTDIRPVTVTIGTARFKALSATDAVRDRLAAFYHWQDRSSLVAAVDVALRHRIDMALVRRWSAREGAAAPFEEFRQLVMASRRRPVEPG